MNTGTSPSPQATAGATTPNVVGKDLDDGVNELKGAGFTSQVAWEPDPDGRGRPCSITSQQPAAGAPIPGDRRASVRYVSGRNCTEGID